MPKDQAYLVAEKKITEALKSGTTELDPHIPGDSHLRGDCHLTHTQGG